MLQTLCQMQHFELVSPEVQTDWSVAAPRTTVKRCARKLSNELHSICGQPQEITFCDLSRVFRGIGKGPLRAADNVSSLKNQEQTVRPWLCRAVND